MSDLQIQNSVSSVAAYFPLASPVIGAFVGAVFVRWLDRASPYFIFEKASINITTARPITISSDEAKSVEDCYFAIPNPGDYSVPEVRNAFRAAQIRGSALLGGEEVLEHCLKLLDNTLPASFQESVQTLVSFRPLCDLLAGALMREDVKCAEVIMPTSPAVQVTYDEGNEQSHDKFVFKFGKSYSEFGDNVPPNAWKRKCLVPFVLLCQSGDSQALRDLLGSLRSVIARNVSGARIFLENCKRPLINSCSLIIHTTVINRGRSPLILRGKAKILAATSKNKYVIDNCKVDIAQRQSDGSLSIDRIDDVVVIASGQAVKAIIRSPRFSEWDRSEEFVQTARKSDLAITAQLTCSSWIRKWRTLSAVNKSMDLRQNDPVKIAEETIERLPGAENVLRGRP